MMSTNDVMMAKPTTSNTAKIPTRVSYGQELKKSLFAARTLPLCFYSVKLLPLSIFEQ